MPETDAENRNTGSGGTTGNETGPTTGAGGTTGNEDVGADAATSTAGDDAEAGRGDER